MGHPMKIKLTHEGLLVYLANHYTTRGAQLLAVCKCIFDLHQEIYKQLQCIYKLSCYSSHLTNPQRKRIRVVLCVRERLKIEPETDNLREKESAYSFPSSHLIDSDIMLLSTWIGRLWPQ